MEGINTFSMNSLYYRAKQFNATMFLKCQLGTNTNMPNNRETEEKIWKFKIFTIFILINEAKFPEALSNNLAVEVHYPLLIEQIRSSLISEEVKWKTIPALYPNKHKLLFLPFRQNREEV